MPCISARVSAARRLRIPPARAAAALLAALLPAASSAGPAADRSGPLPFAALREEAQQRARAVPHVPLAPENASALQGIDALESPDGRRVPNYLRAMAAIPGAVRPLAELVRTVYTRGSVPPELKLAMGLEIARQDRSPYVAFHLERLLAVAGPAASRAALRRALERGDLDALAPAQQAALAHARALGRGPTHLDEATFRRLRTWYTDSQLVELTIVVCFTSYWTRLCEGLAVPIESWALETSARPIPPLEAKPARVSLLTNEEAAAFQEAAARAATASTGPRTSSGLGLGIANSQRAMARAPAHMRTWFGYWSAVRESQVVDRAHKLQVSFAVSMANGCRYCTVHQVVGLRRLGVDPAKLLAMRRDDSALTPRERAAVRFARKLTASPHAVNAADYRALAAEFGEQGALEVLLQTCSFAFMNRFTDGLGLPSEDEAIRIYQEVYGPGSYAAFGKEAR